MARSDNKLLAMLGWNVTGDVGPWTFYTDHRGNITWFPRTPQLSPASKTQQIIRLRWEGAAHCWRWLGREERDRWELAVKRAHCKITGYNLWVYWRTTRDRQTVLTIARQARIDLAIQ